ncbi:MAG TPA: hypothetical protein VIL07_09115 [Symbiobacteriaceae bacterium]
MWRWLALLLVACTAVAGLGAVRRTPGEPEGPVVLTLPAAGGERLLATHLQVRPDGRAFALWHVGDRYALAVWQAEDDEAVLLSRTALEGLAWARDGLYFVQMSAPVGGRAEILRYRWGEEQPEVVLTGGAIRGRPRGLAWRSPGLLLYADDEGLKAAQPGIPWRVSRLTGPGIPDTLQYGAFAPGSLRYIGIQGGYLVLAEAGQATAVPLTEAGNQSLTRVAWSEDGRRVALGLGYAELGGRILLFDVAGWGTPRQVAEVAGGSPLFVGRRFFFVDPEGQVMEWREGQAEPVAVDRPASSLAGAGREGPLYVIRPGPEPAVLQVPLR